MKEQKNASTTKNKSDGIHTEGKMTKNIEEQTSKVPSDIFLFAAIGSMTAAAILKFTGNHKESDFVGKWATPFLSLGIYNKLVKLEGSE